MSLLRPLCAEQQGVSRLTNTTPESWLRMQEAVDLWDLEQEPERYRGIEPVAA